MGNDTEVAAPPEATAPEQDAGSIKSYSVSTTSAACYDTRLYCNTLAKRRYISTTKPTRAAKSRAWPACTFALDGICPRSTPGPNLLADNGAG